MEPLYVTVVDHEARESRSYVFDGPRVRIGRETDNDLHLPYTFISRWHAVVELDGRGARLRDLGAANRMCLDGTELAQGACMALRGRHSLTIGSLELQVESRPSDAAEPSSTGSVGSPVAPSFVHGSLDTTGRANATKTPDASLERLRSARRTYEAALRTWERELAEVTFDLQRAGETEAVARVEREFAVGPGPASALTHGAHAHENAVVALATELMPNERPPNDPDEEREFVSRVSQALRTFASCFIETQRISKAQAEELGVSLCPGDNEPLAVFQEPEELLSYLLDWRIADDGRSYDLIQRFAVVLSHQRGYVCGVLRALRRIARECRPEEIAREVELPWPFRVGSCWRRFAARHEQLFGDGERTLSATLRGYVADEYCEELARSGVPAARRG